MSFLKKASRQETKIKMGITGASGSGKTYSSLLLAYGLCGDWSKIAVLDTENGSANLYSHLGGYLVAKFEPPFPPKRYIDAIAAIEKEGIQVLIIDSISHEWDGKGGCLEMVESVASSSASKNSYMAWGKVTPQHNAFIQAIMQSNMHIICTMRTKTDYVIESNDKGRSVPKKIGLKPITREGIDYEFTLVFDLDQSTKTFSVSKDRTGIFSDSLGEKITEGTGARILEWCSVGRTNEKIIYPSKEEIDDIVI